MKKTLRDQNGSVIIMVTIALVALIAITALAVDGGVKYVTKSRLQNAVDAAALAGAQDLMSDTTGEKAKETAAAYLEKNAVKQPAGYTSLISGGTGVDTLNSSPDVSKLSVSDSLALKTVTYYSKISVTATRTVPLGLGKIFGQATNDVSATAVAVMGPIIIPDSAVPIVATDTMVNFEPFPYELKAAADKGEFYVVEDNDDDPDTTDDRDEASQAGWRGWLDLGVSGNQMGDFFIGTKVAQIGLGLCPYNNGNVSSVESAVNAKIASGNPYVIVPIVETQKDCPTSKDGPQEAVVLYDNNKKVNIIGFANFKLTGYTGTGNDMYITGYFVSNIPGVGQVGGGSNEDYGLYGVNLVQ